jgi:hypothetical protein
MARTGFHASKARGLRVVLDVIEVVFMSKPPVSVSGRVIFLLPSS